MDDEPFVIERPLDEGQVYLGAIEIVEYLDDDGDRGWRLRLDGELPVSSLLGLLRLAEHEILRLSDDDGE